MYLFAYLYVIISLTGKLYSFCPSQCTCVYHGKSDGTGTRSVLCNDPDMYEIPVNVPVDTWKLRVEKTAIRRIPMEAFYYLAELKYLWVTYNCISSIDASSFYNLKVLHELRLDGNLLSVFPWESLAEMPNLRTLDLRNNKLMSVSPEAVQYLRNLTYLDISSNKLTTLPPDIMDMWANLAQITASRSTDGIAQRVILGLQDNPWFCDCRISKMIELAKIVNPSVVFLDSLVACSGPEILAGIFFQRAELEQCLKPSVITSATKITSPLGSNVLLRCDATGFPTPQLLWTKADSSAVNYTVIQDTPGDGIRWSILSLTGISYKDAGDYRCKAKNVAGMSEASITVIVIGTVTTTVSPQRFRNGFGAEQQITTQVVAKEESETLQATSPLMPPSASSVAMTVLALSKTLTTASIAEKKSPKVALEGKKNAKTQTSAACKNIQSMDLNIRETNASVNLTGLTGQSISVRNLKVFRETEERVTLTWKILNATRNSSLAVLYSKHGEKNMLPLSTDPSKNRVTIDGLQPNTEYIACVCAKGASPKKDYCIVFSTDGVSLDGSSQISTLFVASIAACVILLPLIFFLLYKVMKLQCKPQSPGEDELLKEMYVKFETLSLRPSSVGTGREFWTSRETTESERRLLCSSSSVDSQLAYKSESSKPEYFC
ncbi:leucine-rich repeat, immunoglobulin-like domain and transmembrane domain-containing protein 3 [Rhinatrema bivittatum]|uniref:leucine-rich repeat, immunoglobulin-like domain and transmembrane domain-containing protein 3 n=1 Tax=Rhinatrema bivittatum TaxID=194408 RepID=UPI00112CBAEF|nr:leucine-rich repeat, immunoglobulin-like domain and transmembrane domain-containing protein 3 [Rhinatrema bivittatum]